MTAGYPRSSTGSLVHPSVNPSVYSSICLLFNPSVLPSIHLPIYYLSIYPSFVHLATLLLSFLPPIYVYRYLFIHSFIHPYFLSGQLNCLFSLVLLFTSVKNKYAVLLPSHNCYGIVLANTRGLKDGSSAWYVRGCGRYL